MYMLFVHLLWHYAGLYSRVLREISPTFFFFFSFKGLPGVDGREGIPGMPGAKVRHSWHAFNLCSFGNALDLFTHLGLFIVLLPMALCTLLG